MELAIKKNGIKKDEAPKGMEPEQMKTPPARPRCRAMRAALSHTSVLQL